MQNTVTIVLAHPNTEYRKRLLNSCLSQIDGPTILVSNYPIDASTQDVCDWVIYQEENPLLLKKDYEKYNVNFNYFISYPDGRQEFTPFDFEHSYAVYSLITEGLAFANRKGFDIAHVLNYDYIIPAQELENNAELLKLGEYDHVMYRYSANEHLGDFSTGIFSAKIESAMQYFNCERFPTKHDFYSEPYQIFENRYTQYLTNNEAKVFEKKFDDLKEIGQVNQEGLLQFSKSKEAGPIRTFAEISNSFDCDKTTYHEYHKIYPIFIEKFRENQFNLFEIGIDQSKSYKLWKEYFPEANIYGMDILFGFKTDRGEVFHGDQSNIEALAAVKEKIGSAKIIVDDGSHVAEHQLISFEYLFQNLLEFGGVYIIEDIECSYWRPDAIIYGYQTGRLNIVDHFTKLNHQINSRYSLHTNPLHIKSITFAANCIIIVKKESDELVDLPYGHPYAL